MNGLTYLGVAENIFRVNGQLGHEIVFLYAGILDPEPDPRGATLIETDRAVASSPRACLLTA